MGLESHVPSAEHNTPNTFENIEQVNVAYAIDEQLQGTRGALDAALQSAESDELFNTVELQQELAQNPHNQLPILEAALHKIPATPANESLRIAVQSAITLHAFAEITDNLTTTEEAKRTHMVQCLTEFLESIDATADANIPVGTTTLGAMVQAVESARQSLVELDSLEDVQRDLEGALVV